MGAALIDHSALSFPEAAPIIAPWLCWIPGLPLAAFTVLILGGRRLGRLSAWLAIAALAGSFALAWSAAGPVLDGTCLVTRWQWLLPSGTIWSVGFAIDGLSWIMLLVVSGIGTMIQLYSIGYMHDDARFSRFFAYLSLFCASMLTLVLADHFLLLYAGWELVGLCSYLLISFWYEKPAAAAAGRKAFLTTRIGDTGLLLGILLLAWTAGELQFTGLPDAAARLAQEGRGAWLTVISTLVFFGAVGKSAQIPLHVWLPDAMEGPTPVSALIHAATMVAAGVYLVARTFVLFTPDSLHVVLAIGLATHLLAGTVALTQTDIKRILAYSTISQLGLMMTAMGLGAMAAGMFHLVTHAFFKALLFLGAGSVIHAAHSQELARLGGLRRAMPWTALVFLIAALAMSGVPPLSGFWSKDAILLEAQHARPWVFWALLGGAVMTTAYIFRLYLRCFHLPAPRNEIGGTARQAGGPSHHEQIHESPWIMVLPMTLLAVGAAVVGFLGAPAAHHVFFQLVGTHGTHEGVAWDVVAWSGAAAAAGFALAWVVGMRQQRLTVLGSAGTWLYRLAANKYYVDELYGRAVIRPFLRATEWLAAFDRQVVDGAVNGSGMVGWWLGIGQRWVDQRLVDGLVNAVAAVARTFGGWLRRLQTGIVHQYLLALVLSVVVLAVLLRITG